MSKLDKNLRDGYFTSSQISRLCASLKSGLPSSAFYTYVEETYYSVMLGRSLGVEIKTVPIKWGQLMECVLFDMVGLEYTMQHKNTIASKTLQRHSGTPDLEQKGVKVGEIKCYYPKKFAELSLCLMKKDVDLLRKSFPSEYWQCISNAILTGVDTAELLCFMPTKENLIKVIEEVNNEDLLERNGLNPADYYFMSTEGKLIEDIIESLPYLPEAAKLESVNTFEFKVPQADKEFLIDRVTLAQNELKKLLKY